MEENVNSFQFLIESKSLGIGLADWKPLRWLMKAHKNEWTRNNRSRSASQKKQERQLQK